MKNAGSLKDLILALDEIMKNRPIGRNVAFEIPTGLLNFSQNTEDQLLMVGSKRLFIGMNKWNDSILGRIIL